MAKNFDPNFIFPPSVQEDLFNYLKPKQQEAVKPILRVLKKPAQEELCYTLLDYMEQGEAIPPQDITLAAMFMYLTRVGLGDPSTGSGTEFMSKAIIKPLKVQDVSEFQSSKGSKPQPIGDIINSVFGKCFGKGYSLNPNL